jgi:hypothetical protein
MLEFKGLKNLVKVTQPLGFEPRSSDSKVKLAHVLQKDRCTDAWA